VEEKEDGDKGGGPTAVLTSQPEADGDLAMRHMTVEFGISTAPTSRMNKPGKRMRARPVIPSSTLSIDSSIGSDMPIPFRSVLLMSKTRLAFQ
jgi:hypothetical protein